jgi:hypothetical protein
MIPPLRAARARRLLLALGGALAAAALTALPAVSPVAGQPSPTPTATSAATPATATPVPGGPQATVTATATATAPTPIPAVTATVPPASSPAPAGASGSPPPVSSSPVRAVLQPGQSVTLGGTPSGAGTSGGVTVVNQSDQTAEVSLALPALSISVPREYAINVPGRSCRASVTADRLTCSYDVAAGDTIAFTTELDEGGRGVQRQATATPAPTVAPATPTAPPATATPIPGAVQRQSTVQPTATPAPRAPANTGPAAQPAPRATAPTAQPAPAALPRTGTGLAADSPLSGGLAALLALAALLGLGGLAVARRAAPPRR